MVKYGEKRNIAFSLLMFLLSFIFIYDPWFAGYIRGVLLSGVLFFILCISFSKRGIIVSQEEISLIIVLLFFTVLSFVPSLINITFEVGVFFMYIKMCIYFLLTMFFVRLLPGAEFFIKLLVYGVYTQLLVIFLCLFIPGVREIVFSVHTVESLFYTSEQAYRLYFFSSASFFQLSLFWGFVFNFMAALYREGRVSIFVLFAVFICGVFSGRVFFIFAFMTVVFYGIRLRYIPLYALVIISMIFIALQYSDNIYVLHALEPLIKYIQNNELETMSSDKLLNEMLFMPNLSTFITGDGLYYNTDGSYYMHTDSGILRQILYGGFLYSLLCIGATFYLLSLLSKKWFRNHGRFLLSTMFILLIGNIKADAMMYPAIMLNLIFALLLVTSNKNDKNVYSITEKLYQKK